MKKLQRPHCDINFKNYEILGNRWDLLNKNKEDKATIKALLLEMSHYRCSYCEIEIQDSSSHIEHLARRQCYPKKTFDWNNLFCSCNTQETCGSYKDNEKKYTGDSSDLIKPDTDNPKDYLNINSQDGSFYEKEEEPKASKTIEYFNLNAPRLKFFRLNFINIAKDMIDDYLGFIDDIDDDSKELCESVFNDIEKLYKESDVDELGFIQIYLKQLHTLLQ